MKNLKTYLKKNKITQKKFSEKLNVHYMTIYQIVKGKRRPSPELAALIEQATGGEVTRMELLYPSQKGENHE